MPSSVRDFTVTKENSRYYQHPNRPDVEVPSVSTILNVMDKPALLPWAVKMTAEYVADNIDLVTMMIRADREDAIRTMKNARYKKTNAAIDSGVSAHDVIEGLALGYGYATPPAMAWAERAWTEFNEQFAVKVLYSEATVFNEKVGYAGSLDLLCEVDGEIALVDVKTTNGVYDTVALQCTAYSMADHILVPGTGDAVDEVPMPEVTRNYCLWVRPSGWALLKLRYDEASWSTFRALARVHRWAAVDKKTAVGKPLNLGGLTAYRDKKWLAAQAS